MAETQQTCKELREKLVLVLWTLQSIVEVEGDIGKPSKLLREGMAKAAKKQVQRPCCCRRLTGACVNGNALKAVVEVNAETDFCCETPTWVTSAGKNAAAKVIAEGKPANNEEALFALTMSPFLVVKLLKLHMYLQQLHRRKISFRRFAFGA